MILFLTMFFGSTLSASDNLISNGSFEVGADNETINGWEVAMQEGYSVALVSGFAVEGNGSLYFRPQEGARAAMIRQEVTPEWEKTGSQVLRGAIRTRGLEGQAALFVMAESGGKRIFMDDMRNRAVSGDAEWQHFDIEVPNLPSADTLYVGALVVGAGEA
jgi:hypothetical protein